MEALPPNPRDFALSRQDSWTERRASARSLGIPAPESALGLRLRRALPSAQVRSVYQGRKIRNVAVYTKHLTLPKWSMSSHNFFNNQGAVWNTIQKAPYVTVQHPIHLLPRDRDVQRVQRLMLATLWSEARTRNPENPLHKSR